jgi:hypothetical protein
MTDKETIELIYEGKCIDGLTQLEALAAVIAELSINKATISEISKLLDGGAKNSADTDPNYESMVYKLKEVGKNLKFGEINLTNSELLIGFRQATAYQTITDTNKVHKSLLIKAIDLVRNVGLMRDKSWKSIQTLNPEFTWHTVNEFTKAMRASDDLKVIYNFAEFKVADNIFS